MRPKLVELRTVFDAFCRGFHAERPGKVGNRRDNGAGARAGQQIVDEASVDLDLIEREALQIAERRVARPEVVKGYTDTEGAKPVQQLERRFTPVEEYGTP